MEKPSEPVWSIFTKEGAKLQKYDIFPTSDKPEAGRTTNTTNLAPGVKLENRTSPRPTGSFNVKEEDLSPKSREKVQQSGSEKDRTSTRAEGRFMAKEENVSSGLREIVQLGGGEKVHSTPFEILPKEFRPSTSTSTCEEPGEAAAAALKYFERKRLESGRKSNFPVLDYQSTLKKYYPEFCNNAENGIVGHVPGVEVGLILRYRDELRLLGIHREKQKGIDSKDVLREDCYNYERVALSVVLSGVYEDCKDHGEVLIYVGEGGRDPKSNQQVKDQTKKRLGNQALKNNYHRKSPVRVIRKRMDASSPSKRLFSYDGLYKVEDWEYITGMAGFKVYRFKLVRERNQNPLVWQKREPKPFVGHATRQDAIAKGETKPFVGQVGRIASRKGKKPAVGQAARRGATASGEIEPSGRSVGQAARSEVTGRGESEVNFIDISDEESVSSESEDSSENSVIELSDDESVSLDESDEDSMGGSVETSDVMPSEDSEENPANIPIEEDDVNGVDGEEGGDCSVHEKPDQGRQVSPECVEVEEELRKDQGASESDNSKQDVVGETTMGQPKGEQTGNNVEEGEAGGPAGVQAIPLHVEEEALDDGLDNSTAQPSRLSGQLNVEELDGIEDGRKIEHALDNIEGRDGEYEVEEIVDKRMIGKRRQVKYLVRWKGYSESDDTWEPVSNLHNCRQLVEDFNSSRKNRRLHRRG